MKTLLTLLIAAIGLTQIGYAEEFTPKQKAQLGTLNAHQYMNSPDKIQKNFTGPMFSTEKMMSFGGTTFDDKEIACQSSTKFLELSVTGTSTGDINPINLAQDINLDTAVDYVYKPDVTISGICINGMVSCTAGTFKDCSYYAWASNTNGALYFRPAAQNEMQGCYCVNNSCAPGFVSNNMERITSDLGGGAVAALAATNPYYTVSKATQFENIIAFNAQELKDCKDGRSQNTLYMNEPHKLLGDAFLQTQSNEYYTVIENSATGRGLTGGRSTCEVTRVVPMNQRFNDISFTVKTAGEASWMTVQFDLKQGTYTLLNPSNPIDRYVEIPKVDFDLVCKSGSNITFDGYVRWDDPPLPGYTDRSVYYRILQEPSCDNGLVGIVQSEDVQHNRESNENLAAIFSFSARELHCSLGQDYYNDLCATFDKRSDCSLIEETTDGVLTVQQSTGTGYAPPPIQIVAQNGLCSETVTRPWQKKTRSYQCTQTAQYNFDDALQRQVSIESTITGTKFTNKFKNDKGSWQTADIGWKQPVNDADMTSCPKVCTTTKAEIGTDVTPIGPVTDGRRDPLTNTTKSYACFGDICPHDAGETVVKGCACVSDFPEAAAALKALKYASDDMRCSP